MVIEVGEVMYKNQPINLDEVVSELGERVGFSLHAILINKQRFTKLSNCFGVANHEKGTNTNRCVVLTKSNQAFNYENLYAGKYSKELFSVLA